MRESHYDDLLQAKQAARSIPTTKTTETTETTENITDTSSARCKGALRTHWLSSGSAAAWSRGGTASGVGLDALVEDGGDLINGLLRNTLADSGNLGDERLAERLCARLLLLEVLEDNAGDANLIKVGLLGDESVHQARHRGLKITGDLLEAESLLKLQRLGVLDFLAGLGDDVLSIGGGGQDRLCGSNVVSNGL
ncbi:hypothetical protein ColTof4_12761 [Colletotrichum tofieldiae]|nr:hypothetical protein ColTof4_12761 [Colletotrichum tofieldiae]